MTSNMHISRHPCVRAKLSQLRSKSTTAKETKALVNEIALLVSCEALAGLEITPGPEDESHLPWKYTTQAISPKRIAIVPILRSGLGMLDAVQTVLPDPAPVHHLGLFREPATLQPVEYYNNLPFHARGTSGDGLVSGAADLAIVIDPVVATGGTMVAAIQTLKEWGVKKIIVICILGSDDGLKKVSEEWPEAVEIWAGGVDQTINDRGMLVPGLGDIGDRLFLTIGK